MVDKALYSSRTEEWETPVDLFDRLHAIYHFQLDACASATNAKCRQFFTRSDDALVQSWAQYGRVWMNPPYGRQIGQFMKKACEKSQKGSLVVALVPARTDTKWWHNWIAGKADTLFLHGRLRYLDVSKSEQHAAPFPSVLIIYQPNLGFVCNDDGGARLGPGLESN